MTVVDVSVCAVPDSRKAEFLEHCRAIQPLFREWGALAVMDTWGSDVPEGKLTDFHKAVKAEPGETVCVGWVIWKDQAARDAGWKKMETDDRMHAISMPFDGKRMIFGSFEALAES